MASSLITPLLISYPWGYNASNPTYINIPIPVPTQTGIEPNLASFNDGFPPSTMTPEASGGLPFYGQDMNGILYMITAYCANFAAGALQQYNATLSSNISGYPAGAVLSAAQPTWPSLWVNIAGSGNTTDPDTGGAGWYPFGGVGLYEVTLASSNVTLTALEAALPLIVLTGTLTGNVSVTFPANVGQNWVIVNECTGAFTVTAKCSTGSGVTVPATGQTAPTSVYCDNSGHLNNTGVSTAGLAPIASPALTGTPTAPTASASTNTTQIATTAMVQAAITAALSPYATKASPIFSGVPQAPTAAPLTDNAQIATTAYCDAAIVAAVAPYRAGTFNCSNGTVSVAFSSALPFVPIVTVTWNYATPDVGFIVPGSITTTGFQYTNGNAGLCNYIAVQAV